METLNSTDSLAKDESKEQSNKPNLSHHELISMKLGGRFSADLADLLPGLDAEKTEDQSTNSNRQASLPKPLSKEDFLHREFAQLSLKRGNPQQAIDYISKHSPANTSWLEEQLATYRLKAPTAKPAPVIPEMLIVHKMLDVDPELGRLACVLGEFNLFRAWAYAREIDDGDGWLDRAELEKLWKENGIAKDKRQARRLINNGVALGFWTHHAARKRIYLSGQAKLAARFTNRIIERDLYPALQTNLPGKWRVETDLSGGLQQAEAMLYVAWIAVKDTKGNGTTISRESLEMLWQRSIPTLLAWEKLIDIEKQANFAQQNDTSLDNVPAHSYLTLNRDGTKAVAWRLPNTYKTVAKLSINRRGKAKKIKQAVKFEIGLAKQRGFLGDAASPAFDKLYFNESQGTQASPFDSCEKYYRKLSREDRDIYRPRYFYVGHRRRVKIFEPFNIHSNRQESTINQRLIWKEKRPEFAALRNNYRRFLAALP